MTRRVQWMALFVLLGLWAGVGMWVMASAPKPRHVPLTYVTGRADQTGAGRTHASSGLSINLDQLTAARRREEETIVSPKNIFASLSSDKDAAPRGRRRASAPPRSVPGPASAPPAAPPPPSAEELAAQAARRELSQYRYLGYLARAGKEEAFLSKGPALYVVKPEETIDNTVLVKTVTRTSVILQDTRTRVEQAVAIVEGAP